MAEVIFEGFREVNIDLPPYRLPDKTLAGLTNGWLRYGQIKRRYGLERLITLPTGVQQISLVHRAILPAGEFFFLGYYDGVNWKLARWQEGASSWTVLGNLPGKPTCAVTYKGWVFICTTGGMRKTNGINLFNWGISAPTTVPSASVGTSGYLNGQYQWRVTFVRNIDNYIVESNPSPASNQLTLTNQRANLTIPVSSDPQVTGRRIYRLGGTISEWRFVAEINDNTTTSFTDNTPDSALLGAAPLSFYNDPPPVATIAVVHRERIFLAGNPSYPTRVYFSTYGSPEYFPPSTPNDPDGGSWFEVGQQDGQPVTAMAPVGTMLAIFKSRACWILRGESQADFVLQPFANIGAVSQDAVVSMEGAVFLYDGTHLYMFTGSEFNNLSELRFSKAFKGTSPSSVRVRGDIAERLIWIITPNALHIYDLMLNAYIGVWNKSGVTFYDVIGDDPSRQRGTFILSSAGLLKASENVSVDYDGSQIQTSVTFPTIRIPAEMLKRCYKAIIEGTFTSGSLQVDADGQQWTLSFGSGIIAKSYAPSHIVGQSIGTTMQFIGELDRLILDIVPLRRVN